MPLPATAGQSLSGFLDAYYKAAQNRRLEEMMLRQNEAAALQGQQSKLAIEALQRQAATEQAVPGMLEAAQSIVPQVSKPMAQLPVSQGLLENALEAGVPATTTTPQPHGLPVTGITESQLKGALTLPQYQASLTTPAGQQMRKTMGITTDDARDREIQRRDALANFESRSGEWQQKMLGDDIKGAYLARIAANRSLLPFVDQAHQARLIEDTGRATETLTRWTKDDKELRAAQAELPGLWRTYGAAIRNLDDPAKAEAFFEAAGKATSKDGRADALKLGQSLATMAKAVTPVGQFQKLVAAHQAANPKATREESYKAAYQQNPALAEAAHDYAIEKKIELPPDFYLGVTGRMPSPNTADSFKRAEQMVYDSGLRPSQDPKTFNAAVMDTMQRIEDIKHRKSQATPTEQRMLAKTMEQSRLRMSNLMTDAQKLRTGRDKYMTSTAGLMEKARGDEQAKKPRDPNAPPPPPTELQKYDAAIAKIRDQIRDEQRYYDWARDSLIAGGGAAGPVAVPPPVVPPPVAPPAAKPAPAVPAPPKPARPAAKLRGATRAEASAAKSYARGDEAKFDQYLLHRGIDSNLPVID